MKWDILLQCSRKLRVPCNRLIYGIANSPIFFPHVLCNMYYITIEKMLNQQMIAFLATLKHCQALQIRKVLPSIQSQWICFLFFSHIDCSARTFQP